MLAKGTGCGLPDSPDAQVPRLRPRNRTHLRNKEGVLPANAASQSSDGEAEAHLLRGSCCPLSATDQTLRTLSTTQIKAQEKTTGKEQRYSLGSRGFIPESLDPRRGLGATNYNVGFLNNTDEPNTGTAETLFLTPSCKEFLASQDAQSPFALM